MEVISSSLPTADLCQSEADRTTKTAGAELGLRLAVRDSEVNEAAGQHAESIQLGGENPS